MSGGRTFLRHTGQGLGLVVGQGGPESIGRTDMGGMATKTNRKFEPTEADQRIEATEADQAAEERKHVFQERRDQEFIDEGYLPPNANPNSQDLHDALGHWADWDLGTRQDNNGVHKIERWIEGEDATHLDQQLAVNEIHNHYMIQKPEDLDGNLLPPEARVLDLSSADSRLGMLDNLVQNKAGDPYGERTCGAASLVGAGVLAGGGKNGGDGLKTVMDAMSANAKGNPQLQKYLDGDPKDKGQPGVLTGIRKRVADGTATVEDMQTLQRELYNQLQNKESKDASDQFNKVNNDPKSSQEQKDAAEKAMLAVSGDGLEADTLKNFMHSTPAMDKMMKDKGMGISFIKNDPIHEVSSHAVLTIENGAKGPGAIYDPELRDDGQVVTDKTELGNYGNAQVTQIQ